ncbi:MAG TPA: peptide chain release factor N(5)-glutamine methyltransferase [Candidatus Doudnabacteria bacterium]|nr:peptide chain release factor N(5)-glutamine methyltransferase [Candidatus Doudnabacteria bacterium]
MTIRSVLKQHPQPEIELLLGHVLKQSKEFLYLHPDLVLSKTQQSKFNKLLSEFQDGKPVAYLIGHKYFYGFKFKVNKHTLIPRPESEWLVDKAIALTKGINSPKIIDIGTGSGCLAISIGKILTNNPKIYATDISPRALEIAKHNAKQQKVGIKFKIQDLLKNDMKKYDLIIANLPYVPKKTYQKFKSNLKFEPKSALVDPINDFGLYEKLLTKLSVNMSPNGNLLLEIDPSMKSLIKNWLKKNMPRTKVTFARDIHKLWRYCRIR